MADDNLNFSSAKHGLGEAIDDIFDVRAALMGAQALSEKISEVGESVPRILEKACEELSRIARLLDEVDLAISNREKEHG